MSCMRLHFPGNPHGTPCRAGGRCDSIRFMAWHLTCVVLSARKKARERQREAFTQSTGDAMRLRVGVGRSAGMLGLV